ncbi:MAG: cysteine synthase family protein [Myxococcales bacterium]|nr:cysteine synthase family protein [Myxococcales bacterium]
MRGNSVLDLIGRTPHVRLSRLFPASEVWMKLEKTNPAGSIKDRIALAMIEDAELKGVLRPGGTIIEPTSGNTGIGLAMVAAVKGYELVLVMPESMSLERRKLMAAYGAKFHLTPRAEGMPGAIRRARELAEETPGAFMPSQFENAANPDIHRMTSAIEILEDFPEGVDALVTGVGTGGHITGVGQILKERFPGVRVVAVEPERSAVLSAGPPPRIVFRELARASSLRSSIDPSSTRSSQSRTRTPSASRAARHAKRACSSVCRAAPPWPRSIVTSRITAQV